MQDVYTLNLCFHIDFCGCNACTILLASKNKKLTLACPNKFGHFKEESEEFESKIS